MKNIIILLIIGFLFSCNNPSQNKTTQTRDFKTVQLGGGDLHGDLYQKKYFEPSDTKIHYDNWIGYDVSSNREIEDLYEIFPECEAIRISFGEHDTLQNSELTQTIGKFKNLKFLEIHSNRIITTYPKSIENLKNLEELVLQVRSKKSIEFDFSNFRRLKHLTIDFAGDLLIFPYTIFNCTNLETLKLFGFLQIENNTLNGLEKLEKLRELYIWDSHLIIPNSDFKFTQLETLIINGNHVVKLPSYFWSLRTMKRFALCSPFDTLNLNDVSNMRNLETLVLNYQQHFLGKLELPNLEHLEITDYRGKVIDIGIEELPSLESLVFWGCVYIENIEGISNRNLRSITVNSNDILKSVELDLNKLENIEEVEMKYNDSLKINETTIKALRIRMN